MLHIQLNIWNAPHAICFSADLMCATFREREGEAHIRCQVWTNGWWSRLLAGSWKSGKSVQSRAKVCPKSRKNAPTKAKLNQPQLHGHVVCEAHREWFRTFLCGTKIWEIQQKMVEDDKKEGREGHLPGSWQFYNLIVLLPRILTGL